MPLIVTGSIGIDSIHAPTGEANDVLGGSCTHFAAAASFFSKARIVAAVGDDFPDHHLETMKKFNVDLEGLEKRAGSKTFRWRGKYHENMNERDTLEVDLNVLAEALPPVPDAYKDSEYIFLANTHPAAQVAMLDQFPGRKLSVADTMDLWIETEREGLINMIEKVDGLVLNDSEAIMLTEDSNAVRAADKILEIGPKFVIVKKGEHGAFLVHQDGHIALPAYPARNVVDPTGAGDSFAGGMMGHLAATGDLSINGLRKAMAYGTVVASFNIESFSLQRLTEIKRSDIDARLQQFRAMTEIGE